MPSLPFRPLRGVAALALVFVWPATARAIDVKLDTPRVRSDSVWVDVRLEDIFEPRVEESLSRGMPATLQIHAEMWHRRTGWFDRLETTVDAELRMRYDVVNRVYRLERQGALPKTFDTLDSLTVAIAGPLAMPVGRVRDESRNAWHFVVVTVTLRPLSVEDAAEVESWLSGEVESKKGSGFGLITQVPRALFDAIRNVAGFGDDRGRAISEDFRVRSR